ncbi:MAG: hypothetical protein WCD37_19740 [Chloroflexia bacterium]
MASARLIDLMKQVDELTLDEKLALAAHLIQQARYANGEGQPRPKWSDIHGAAPNLLNGEDAQEWVTRGRREADENREKFYLPANPGDSA